MVPNPQPTAIKYRRTAKKGYPDSKNGQRLSPFPSFGTNAQIRSGCSVGALTLKLEAFQVGTWNLEFGKPNPPSRRSPSPGKASQELHPQREKKQPRVVIDVDRRGSKTCQREKGIERDRVREEREKITIARNWTTSLTQASVGEIEIRQDWAGLGRMRRDWAGAGSGLG